MKPDGTIGDCDPEVIVEQLDGSAVGLSNDDPTPSDPFAASGGMGDSEDSLVGRVIGGRYLVTRTLARGGMGKVYAAQQTALAREVALKVLSPSSAALAETDFHMRFIREAAICAKLSHPNTITVFDYGVDDGICFIAMEFLQGRTLHRAIRTEGPFTVERALKIARQICRALQEAHSLGVIHRDLKPANVYLTERDEYADFVKVLDFGLVKEVRARSQEHTRAGSFMGTPRYMAPEQIRKTAIDARADIYALGCVLYQMLTGRVPFVAETDIDILNDHLHTPVPPMSEVAPDVAVPLAVEDVVRIALEKDPNDRYPDMQAFLKAIESVSGTTTSISALPRERPSGLHDMSRPPFVPASPPVGEARPTDPSMGKTVLIGSGDSRQLLRSRRRRAALGALAGALAAVGCFFGWRAVAERPVEPPSDATSVAASARETPISASEGPAVRDEASPPARLIVAFRSNPPGATVVADQEAYGPTPADVVWTGDQARRGRMVAFRFQLEGHQDYTVSRRIDGERIEVTAELAPIPPEVRPRRRPAGMTQHNSEQSTSMDPFDFVENPY